MTNPIDELTAPLQTYASGTQDLSDEGLSDSMWRHINLGSAIEWSVQARSFVKLLQELIDSGALAEGSNVARSAAYSVAEITGKTIEFVITDSVASREATQFAWIVACAWQAALAGDIQDLRDHVCLEAGAKGIHLTLID